MTDTNTAPLQAADADDPTVEGPRKKAARARTTRQAPAKTRTAATSAPAAAEPPQAESQAAKPEAAESQAAAGAPGPRTRAARGATAKKARKAAAPAETAPLAKAKAPRKTRARTPAPAGQAARETVQGTAKSAPRETAEGAAQGTAKPPAKRPRRRTAKAPAEPDLLSLPTAAPEPAPAPEAPPSAAPEPAPAAQPEAPAHPEPAAPPSAEEPAAPEPPVAGLPTQPEPAAEPPAPTPTPAAVIPISEGPPPEPARPLFADLGLSEDVLRAIADMGYRHPTPIQEQAIPFVLMGRDVLGTAQTGTGKTASFTLPMLDILTGSRARARMPRSLILEPTRELALQVADNFVQYGKYLKLTHALIIGGESMTDQREVLNRGVDVLIATPGRLLDMFDRGSILLSDTRLLVIDEADRMLDMGFIPDVERIVSLLPAMRQTLFFSATMGPEIRRLADAFLQNPKEIAVSRPASVAATITEGLALVAEHDKREALRRLVRTQNVQNALIFCNRKRDVDILFKSLNKHRFNAGALHGDMAQTLRFSTLEKFKAGQLQLLVCSDVAARGIDIGGLSHVFNFDVPIHAEDYVHRIGRTGRAGLEGKAFTIAVPEDRYHVEQIEKLIGHPIPPVVVEGLDPVDWSERKRKGNRHDAKEERKARRDRDRPDRDRPNRERPDRERPDRERPDRDHKRDRDRDRPRPDRTAQPAAERRPAERRDEPRRPDGRSQEGRSQERRHQEGRSQEARHQEGRREDRRERHRRDDDHGPAVVGFGDEIPAFMFLRARRGNAGRTNDNRDSDS